MQRKDEESWRFRVTPRERIMKRMDEVLEAARTGNVEDLHRVLRVNPVILHCVALESRENPLHLACLCGHLDFTRELLILKPDFSKKLNPNGYSPLHMAAANGHLEIVKALVRFDRELSHLKGRDMITPLHSATLAGEIAVIDEILSFCPHCIEDVTIQGETVFHLAVKSSQYESLQVLVDWVTRMGKEEIINLNDEQNNTAMSLAMQMKERRALQLLSTGTSHLVFPTNEETLGDIIHSPEDSASSSHHSTSTSSSDYFKFQKGRDSPGDARTALLVIAVLVATATYQVGLSPPGGVWQDNNIAIAGTSILATYSDVGFIIMLGFNSIGFSVSLAMIGMLTSRFPLRVELIICLTALYVTYSIAVNNITPVKVRVISTVFTSVLPISVSLVIYISRKYLGPIMGPCGRSLLKYRVVRALVDVYR